MANKKKFKDTTVGKMLLGAAGLINPTLGSVLLDSVESVPFHIGELWNDTFEKVMMAVVLAYFGGRTTEKATSMFKK